MRHLQALVGLEVHTRAVVAPVVRRRLGLSVRHHLVATRMEHEHGRGGRVLGVVAERELIQHRARVAARREEVIAVRKRLVAQDLLEREAQLRTQQAPVRRGAQDLLPASRKRVLDPAELRVRVHEPAECRRDKPGTIRAVNVPEPLAHVGHRAAHGPADHVQLGRVDVLQAGRPAGGECTARVAVAGHHGVRCEVRLVELERGAYAVQHSVALQEARGECGLRAFVVRHRDDPALVEQCGKEQLLVRHLQVVKQRRTIAQRIARRTLVAERVLVHVAHDQLVVVVALRHQHGGHRVRRDLLRDAICPVQQLVSFHIELQVAHLHGLDFACPQDCARLLVLPAIVRRIERVVLRGGQPPHRRSKAACHQGKRN